MFIYMYLMSCNCVRDGANENLFKIILVLMFWMTDLVVVAFKTRYIISSDCFQYLRVFNRVN